MAQTGSGPTYRTARVPLPSDAFSAVPFTRFLEPFWARPVEKRSLVGPRLFSSGKSCSVAVFGAEKDGVGGDGRHFGSDEVGAAIGGHVDEAVIDQKEEGRDGIERDLRGGFVRLPGAFAQTVRKRRPGGAKHTVIARETVFGQDEGVAQRRADAVVPKLAAHVEGGDMVLGAEIENQAVGKTAAQGPDAASVAQADGHVSGQIRSTVQVIAGGVHVFDRIAVCQTARTDAALDKTAELAEKAAVDGQPAFVSPGSQDGQVVFDGAGPDGRQGGACASVVQKTGQVHVDGQRRHVGITGAEREPVVGQNPNRRQHHRSRQLRSRRAIQIHHQVRQEVHALVGTHGMKPIDEHARRVQGIGRRGQILLDGHVVLRDHRRKIGRDRASIAWPQEKRRGCPDVSPQRCVFVPGPQAKDQTESTVFICAALAGELVGCRRERVGDERRRFGAGTGDACSTRGGVIGQDRPRIGIRISADERAARKVFAEIVREPHAVEFQRIGFCDVPPTERQMPRGCGPDGHIGFAQVVFAPAQVPARRNAERLFVIVVAEQRALRVELALEIQTAGHANPEIQFEIQPLAPKPRAHDGRPHIRKTELGAGRDPRVDVLRGVHRIVFRIQIARERHLHAQKGLGLCHAGQKRTHKQQENRRLHRHTDSVPPARLERKLAVLWQLPQLI